MNRSADSPNHGAAGFEPGTVEVRVSGSYLLRRPIRGTGRALIVGFHGYAETAEIQAARLAAVPGAEDDWLCSVQALHPFYRSRTGEVVAGWMTRFRREEAIRENRAFVDRVLEAASEAVPNRIPLIFAGFSQGAAMAYRAATSGTHPPAAVIVLGGDLPPDLTESGARLPIPVLVGRGRRDPFYSEGQFRKDLRALERLGAQTTPCEFEGGHDWNEAFSARAGEFTHEALRMRSDSGE